MSIPHETGPVPARVRRLVGGAEVQAVCVNSRGGTTYRADGLLPRPVERDVTSDYGVAAAAASSSTVATS